MLYLDSSAWVRLFLKEANYTAVRAYVAKAEDRICYELGYVEVRAALAAAHRAKRIDDAAHEQVKRSVCRRMAEKLGGRNRRGVDSTCLRDCRIWWSAWLCRNAPGRR